jgi:hypothetical protein
VLKNIKSYLKKNFKLDNANKLFNSYSVDEWMSGIKNASIILTNSYHGMIFSLIFHVSFIIIPEKGLESGMNDRFISLLTYLNLEHRILKIYDVDKLNMLIDEQIDWQKVDTQLAEFRNETNEYFDRMLN